EIPYGSPTAVTGKWKKGPGKTVFEAIEKELHALPIIAEDLGEMDPGVYALRDALNLPGMKVLQFAFASDASDPFLPHNYPSNCVVYTGTHDNDTSVGWYRQAPEKERDFYRRYLARSGDDIAWDLIRAAWSSKANYAIAPLQDLLNLGTEARMNYPGKPSGNWGWRYLSSHLSEPMANRLREQNVLYGRT
ncbi:MAG: 4-alpha-glucanotransferase, partial [Anaerolineaceae bacterium]|nr:4-alpha-glucanotransferase [Anaerolineaceae bacterium]